MNRLLLVFVLVITHSLSAMNEDTKKVKFDETSKRLVTNYKDIDFVLRLLDDYLNKENEESTLEDEANILNQLNPCLEKLEAEFKVREDKENIPPNETKPDYYVKRFPQYEE